MTGHTNFEIEDEPYCVSINYNFYLLFCWTNIWNFITGDFDMLHHLEAIGRSLNII